MRAAAVMTMARRRGLAPPSQSGVTFNRTLFTAAAENTEPPSTVIARDSVVIVQGDASGVAFARAVKAANPTTACLLYTNSHWTMSSADCAAVGVGLPDQNAYAITGDASGHFPGQVPMQAGWDLKNIAGRRLYNRYSVPLFFLDMGVQAVRDAMVSGLLARLELDNAVQPTWDGVMLDDLQLAMSGNPLSDFWNGVDQAAYNAPIGNGFITQSSPPSPPQTTFLINGAANNFPYLPAVLGDDASADLSTLCGKFQDWTSAWIRDVALRIRAAGTLASYGRPYLIAGNVSRWYRPLGTVTAVGGNRDVGQARLQPYRDVSRWLDYSNTEGLSDNGPGYDATASAGTPGAGGTWQFNSNYAWMRDIAEASAFSPAGSGIHMAVGHHALDGPSQLYGLCMLLVAVFDPKYASWGNYNDAISAGDAYWDANFDTIRGLGNVIGGGGSGALGAYTAADFDAAINAPAGVIFWRSFQNGVVACNPFGVSVTQSVNGVSVTLPATSGAVYQTPGPVTPPVVTGTPGTALRISVVNASQKGTAVANRCLGAGLVWDPIDIGNGTSMTAVDAARAKGFGVLARYNPGVGPSGGLNNRSAAQVGAEVAAVKPLLQARGITELVIGNEPWFNNRDPNGDQFTGTVVETATTYASKYAAGKNALAGSGITAIAMVTGSYDRTGLGNWSDDSNAGWIRDFVAALPGGMVPDAFDCHPYPYNGDPTVLTNEDTGWPAVARWHTIALGLGLNIPWYMTEVGERVSQAGGQAAQATVINRLLSNLTTADAGIPGTPFNWFNFVAIYTAVDDNPTTGDWGILNTDGTPRPAFAVLP